MTTPINMRKPIAAINDASCALACIEFLYAEDRPHLNQTQIIQTLTPYFSNRGKFAGDLKPAEVVYVLEILHCSPCNILISADPASVCAFTKAHRGHGGFVFTLNPDKHAMAIVELRPDGFTVMDPHRYQPRFKSVLWDDFPALEARVLLIAEEPNYPTEREIPR